MPSRNKECYHRPCGPVAAAGHSVVLVKDKMYTIFGYNPIYGYLNLIQEYSIGNQNYSIKFFFWISNYECQLIIDKMVINYKWNDNKKYSNR